MRLLIRVIFYTLLLCAAAHLSKAEEKAPAKNWLINVDELSINYKKFQPSSRHPLFYNSKMKEGIDLNMNNNMLFDYVFWDNTIHSSTNSSQYYLVGWQFKFGARVTNGITVQYEHHSQHILDSTYPYMKFPVEDSLGFTIRIFSTYKRGRSIF